MRVGRALTLYRTAEKMTQRELAAEIGLDFSVMWWIECGKGATPETIAKVITWLLAPEAGRTA